MKHLFVPYNLALLAKEKGFNEECLAMYNSHGMFFLGNQYVMDNDHYKNDSANAPIYQQLVDWFREKHKIYITVDNSILSHKYQIHGRQAEQIKYNSAAGTYYEALNTALTESFKLI